MDARARFDEIADDRLARDDDVELTHMMGMPALKRRGKLWVGFWKDEMVFDPGERDRPMKEWVVVPAAHERKWANLAEQALR